MEVRVRVSEEWGSQSLTVTVTVTQYVRGRRRSLHAFINNENVGTDGTW